jgi:hypothetical protein
LKVPASLSRHLFLLLSLLHFGGLLGAQVLTGISADWDDSLKEWTIYTHDDHLEGELQTRWMIEEDWSDWSIRLGGLDGRIKMKWKENPNEWELRSGNILVMARTAFNDDFREWRITSGRHDIRLKTRFGNIADEWDASSDHGRFSIRTAYQGDPRDWHIEDELEGVPLEVRVMLVFVAVYSSCFAR